MSLGIIDIQPSILVWARQTLGLTLDEVAIKLKRPAQELADWEAGRAKPTYTQLEQLAELYKQSVATFFLFAPPTDERNLAKEVKRAITTVDPEAMVYLFGSQARGDAHADSDWDFFVATTHNNRTALLGQLVDVTYDLMVSKEALFQFVTFPKAAWLAGASPSPLHDAVRHEGILL